MDRIGREVRSPASRSRNATRFSTYFEPSNWDFSQARSAGFASATATARPMLFNAMVGTTAWAAAVFSVVAVIVAKTTTQAVMVRRITRPPLKPRPPCDKRDSSSVLLPRNTIDQPAQPVHRPFPLGGWPLVPRRNVRSGKRDSVDPWMSWLSERASLDW